ncbi:hypothetical protein [Glaciimonas sp. PCH181]|uniref:hypothetical protein n=1 Tax=Glaciimonas sp. PCH181 TaxID=2133943 RepID=UPI000D386641|nr:hypothetical protein [Glaciimonas sp. PCH181]PUA18859.1 hypothetical protein C7W93_02785 [Glaciimonas sp. PCH181]
MKASNLLLIVFSWSAAALAQAPAPPDMPDAQPEMRPPMQPDGQPDNPTTSSGIKVRTKTDNGFTYVCGGVGIDESNYMKRTSKDYDLMATFAAQDGSYLADVQLVVSSKDGKSTLQTVCSGPIILIKFPRPGTYQISATVKNRPMAKTVQVQMNHGTRTMVFVWPAN